jgi:hypothetical protein
VITRPDTLSSLAKFQWGSGVTLEVSNRRRIPFRVVDWRLDVSDKEGHDSRGRARWRNAWFIISLTLLVIGAMAAVSEQLGKEPPKPDTRTARLELVAATIREVKGKPDEDTAAMRALLSDILVDTMEVDVALAHRVPGMTWSRQRQFYFTAVKYFLDRWNRVLRELNEDIEYLQEGTDDGPP